MLVPARGVERWLSQRLSHRLGHGVGREDGVCAGVQFRSPASLVAELVIGEAGIREHDPWAPDALVWPLLRVVDAHAGEDWCRALSLHLGHGQEGEEGELRRGRRYAVSRRLARLFASYAVQRPALLREWEAGRATDGAGRPLDPDLHLAARAVAAARRGGRRPLARRAARPRARRSPRRPRPARPASALLAVRAHPHPGDGGGAARRAGRAPRRPPVAAAPLGRALGRTCPTCAVPCHGPTTSRTSGWRIRCSPRSDGTCGSCSGHLPPSTRSSRTCPTGTTQKGPLAPLVVLPGRVGREERALCSPGSSTTSPPTRSSTPRSRSLAPDDRSVQVHACHGPARQVEVLREVLLGLLADDPTLEPRDIMVMCPDIEAYAPADLGRLRHGRHRPASRPRAPGPARRPVADPDQPAARRGRPAARPRRWPGARPAGCSTCSRPSPYAGASGSPTPTSRRSPAGWRTPASAGPSTPRHREPFGLGGLRAEHLALRPRPGPGRGGGERRRRPVLRDHAAPRRRRVAPASTWPAGWPSASTGCSAVTDELTGSHPVAHWLTTIGEGVEQLTAVARGEEWQTAQVHRELRLAWSTRRPGQRSSCGCPTYAR